MPIMIRIFTDTPWMLRSFFKPVAQINKAKPSFSFLYSTIPHSRHGHSSTAKNNQRMNDDALREYRENPIGIQMLSRTLHDKVFPSSSDSTKSNMISASENEKESVIFAKRHLEAHSLLGKTLDPLQDIRLQLPNLVTFPGKIPNIQHHFRILGKEQQQPYLQQALNFASSSLPATPDRWIPESGWMKYTVSGAEKVDYPAPDEPLVFDVEVFYKLSMYPAFAVAASSKAWYVWCSKGFLSETPSDELVSVGNPNQKRIFVGHHISYDRARIKEEYNIIPSQIAFIDTMSLHCSVSGLSSQQRNAWTKSRKDREHSQTSNKETGDVSTVDSIPINNRDSEGFPDDSDLLMDNNDFLDSANDDGGYAFKPFNDWRDVSSPSSLANAAELHLKVKVDKGLRDIFGTTNLLGTMDSENFQRLISYCAQDVQVTHSLFSALLPKFLRKCPHPVSFAGMLHMGKSFLTVTENWEEYIQRAEQVCQEYQDQIETRLMKAAENALAQYESAHSDEWLRCLDWTTKPIRMTKPKVNKKGEIIVPSRPYKSANMELAGKPRWYCELWEPESKRIRITPSKRIAPYILKIRWNGYPVYHCRQYGWTYRVPLDEAVTIALPPLIFSDTPDAELYDALASNDKDHAYYRIPHPAGEGKNCGNPLSKGYIQAFDQGNLTADDGEAKEILKLNASCSYWISARDRVKSQFIIWDDSTFANPTRISTGLEPPFPYSKVGIILPQSISMGTVTRRAVEPTWMTASNAKTTRIGSELKSKILAPKGYKFVGADVDSQELWIASLLGDSQFGIHGSTAIGFMTLQGTKSAGTDLHSVTGAILGISRDQAKIFNYSRIYGAGLKHAVQLLMQNQPTLSREAALKKAQDLYHRTKGKQMKVWDAKDDTASSYWSGGSESFMFNQLEYIANSKNPRTPVLDCQIPDSLMPSNVDKQFLTSRVNWVVQSSGVDYLHLLLVSVNYLFRRMNIKGRLLLSIHDEVRFLVPENDVLKSALALQISNIWVRALFASRAGMEDLPLNVAFFSSVDIDHCLRKEVDMSCLTPSQSNAMSPGVSLDIYSLCQKLLDEKINDLNALYGPELQSIEDIVLNTTEDEIFGGDRIGKSPVLPDKVSIVRIKQQLNPIRSNREQDGNSIKPKQKKWPLSHPQRLPVQEKRRGPR